ncbi:c-type cytochrome [Bryobacter aggregatus]|uniref:c-type cytochrome n=1 Tax=Bryobacter aggregatus TaxID=360054 RepID=UPI00056AAE18|nr:c-type cytochrome [Bryobacter aggregatus]
MKRLIGLFLLASISGAIGWICLRGPVTAAPSAVVVQRTPERVARGKYLYEVVADCTGCHSGRNGEKFNLPVIAGRNGAGSAFPKEAGFPGSIVAPNLTPDPESGLGKWTDGEIIRAIREGVSRDGHALFPLMPYQNFAKMSDEDVQSVVAYLRSLPAVRNPLPRSSVDFPVSFLMQSTPQPVSTPVAAPDRADRLAYGTYLATLGACSNCHTRREKGEAVAGMELAGGESFRMPKLEVLSANITPDIETGIGKWSEQQFIDKFKGFANFNESNLPANVQANFTLMPWLSFRQLSEDDLRALYAYLRTVKPVRNTVHTHPIVASEI